MRRTPNNLDQKKIWVSLFLVSAVLILYWPVQHYSFNPLDDVVFITENGHVQDGFTLENLKWALTNTDIGFWKPVTWLSWMLDYQLFWLNAGGYHWTNLILHIINTVLLFLVLNRMTGSVRRSGLVALLFGIHPLHVESVAWIAERKDVLSILFLMLSLWAYDLYVKNDQSLRI
jgi:protein O-mannosyl-transferase